MQWGLVIGARRVSPDSSLIFHRNLLATREPCQSSNTRSSERRRAPTSGSCRPCSCPWVGRFSSRMYFQVFRGSRLRFVVSYVPVFQKAFLTRGVPVEHIFLPFTVSSVSFPLALVFTKVSLSSLQLGCSYSMRRASTSLGGRYRCIVRMLGLLTRLSHCAETRRAFLAVLPGDLGAVAAGWLYGCIS